MVSPGRSGPFGRPALSRGVLVSIITPTYQRNSFLNNTLTYFRTQDYPNIEWLILDDSPNENAMFASLDDENIRYEHVGERLTIGEKRNRLIEKSTGEIIVHFDDDDYYAPGYVSNMVDVLGTTGTDLINLRGWYLYDIRSNFFGYWKLEQKEGLHYCCDAAGVTPVMLSSENNEAFQHNHMGYGFSYAYRRQVWEAVKFPAQNFNEDGIFSLLASEKFELGGMLDRKGLCLHFLHVGSTSRCFPQYHLPPELVRQLFPALKIRVELPAERA